jgi:hypothetical protein
LAKAGIEFVQHRISTDTNWRSFFVHGVPVTRNTLGGSFTVILTDPLDGNIANQSTDFVVVTCTGSYGLAIEKLSARIEPEYQLFAACQSALFATRHMDFQDCTVSSDQWAYASTAVQTNGVSNINMNVFSKQLPVNKSSFQRRFIEGGIWPMEMPNFLPTSPSYVGKYYSDNAVTINANDLPTGGTEMIKNDGFEIDLAHWNGISCTLTRDTSQRRNGVASCLVSGQGFLSAPVQNITEHVVKGRNYNVSFWIRTIEDQKVSSAISCTCSGSFIPITTFGSAVDAKANTWTLVSSTHAASWTGNLTKAELSISSEKNSNFHFDTVSIKDAERQIGKRYIEHVLLGSGNNPYGSKATSPNGIYSINIPGEDLVIRNCRINGTIIVQSAFNVELLDGLLWDPVGRNFPALIANASVDDSTSIASLRENDIGININPASAVYQGVSDNDTSDTYPSSILGSIVSTTDILLDGTSTLSGPIVSDRDINITSEGLTITFQPDMILNPPPGLFPDPPKMRLNTSSVQSVP